MVQALAPTRDPTPWLPYLPNQVDEPEFTQPVMYREIRRADRLSPARAYASQLVAEGLLTNERLEVREKLRA